MVTRVNLHLNVMTVQDTFIQINIPCIILIRFTLRKLKYDVIRIMISVDIE